MTRISSQNTARHATSPLACTQVKPQQACDSSQYLLEVFQDPLLGLVLDVDARHFGNETRFINDFSSVSFEPNVEFTLYRVHTTGELAVAVMTRKAIRRGEELLADYGAKFWTDLKSINAGSPRGKKKSCCSVQPLHLAREQRERRKEITSEQMDSTITEKALPLHERCGSLMVSELAHADPLSAFCKAKTSETWNNSGSALLSASCASTKIV